MVMVLWLDLVSRSYDAKHSYNGGGGK